MVRGVCALSGRVAQPRLFAIYRGNAVLARGIPAGFPLLRSDHGETGAANRGRLLSVTFLGKARKVTSGRAAPGEVVFDLVLIF